MTSGATVVVQARLGSSRLPGKVLADLAGRSLLAWVVRACRAATTVREVILTVPDDDERLTDARKVRPQMIAVEDPRLSAAGA